MLQRWPVRDSCRFWIRGLYCLPYSNACNIIGNLVGIICIKCQEFSLTEYQSVEHCDEVWFVKRYARNRSGISRSAPWLAVRFSPLLEPINNNVSMSVVLQKIYMIISMNLVEISFKRQFYLSSANLQSSAWNFWPSKTEREREHWRLVICQVRLISDIEHWYMIPLFAICLQFIFIRKNLALKLRYFNLPMRRNYYNLCLNITRPRESLTIICQVQILG